MSAHVLRVMAFVLGAAWGSFFNVAIYRWPRDLSVIKPASACPACGTPIPARFNVPIFGWLLLRGRTACCGQPLSPRYPLVELLTAVLAVAVCETFVVQADPDAELLRASLQALCYFAFVGGLLIATFVDLDEWIIPDEVTLPGIALGLATAAFRESPGVEDCAFGAGMAFLMTQLPLVWGYEALTGRRGWGEGDPKLLMMIGAFLGTNATIFCVFAGSLQGLIAAGIALASGRGLRQPEPGSAAADVEPAPLPTTESHAVATDPAQAGDEALAVGPAEAARAELGADPADPADGEPAPSSLGGLKMPFGPFLALSALEFLFFGERLMQWWLGGFGES